MVAIEVKGEYGYVVLGCAILPALVSQAMGGAVMTARKANDVPIPNLYATPGYHAKADEFNRVQRGHQSLFETLTSFTAMSLLGGLKHPYSCTVYGILYSVGSYLYQIGYANASLDVKNARYQRGGALKWIGLFGSLGSSVSMAGSLLGWW